MQKVDINTLANNDGYLIENIPNNIIIVGKINTLIIIYKYDQLDLSKVKCDEIYYYNQEGESIKNHILPNSLSALDCSENKLTSLPDHLLESLEKLYCSRNKLTSLPNLPNSLKLLYCSNNRLTSLSNLPSSLIELYCSDNQLTLLPKLQNSLKILVCDNNQLLSLPDFTHINHKLELSFIQDKPIKYIPYNTNIELYKFYPNKINIEGYPDNPITNQDELDKYMDYIKNYEINRIKSARK